MQNLVLGRDIKQNWWSRSQKIWKKYILHRLFEPIGGIWILYPKSQICCGTPY